MTDAATRRKYIEDLPPHTNAAAWGLPDNKDMTLCYPQNNTELPEANWKPTGGPTTCHRTTARCTDSNCRTMTETPSGWLLYEGQQWAFLDRTFAQWSVYSPLALEWQEFFKKTIVPDEHYFAAVLYSSPFLHTAVVQRQIVFVNWNPSVCDSGTNPCEFTEADLPLLQGQSAPYIRKVMPSNALKKRLGKTASVA